MLEIRRANPEDAIALWSAEVETARVPGRLVSRPDELLLASFEAKIRELDRTGCYVVACEDGELRGHAMLDPMSLEARRHVFQLTVVVHPGHVTRGIGTALVTHLQDWARPRVDVHKVELLVRATNDRAVSLYKQLGFVEEGRLCDRVRLPTGDYVDDLAMAWFPNAAG